jgi:hypothetical protein
LPHEVEAILGIPPGDYTTTGPPMLPSDPNGDVPGWHTKADWLADQAAVRVYYDADNRVLFVMGVTGSRESFLDRLRRLLHL